ncbi:RNA-directed DNA polymerase, eukaryota, partial [Tanacetum coccineum]
STNQERRDIVLIIEMGGLGKFSAKELWTVCKQYGTVVDAFIPDRRSKAGKRFGFVRFIKIFDVDRLVNNLCTIWVGRFKLHANIARFQRPLLHKNNSQSSHNKGDESAPKDFYKESGENVNSKSYAHVVNAGPHQFYNKEDSPAIVLDETYANKTDYSLTLLGKVKDFTSLTNLNVVLANEGFVNVKLKYMGGFWVMIVFTSEGAKKTFRSKVGIGSWFAQLLQASNSFLVDERVTWIDIEGIPLKVWSKNTFSRITSKWGELLDFGEQEDDYLHSKRVCIKTTLVENIYESFKVIIQGKTFWIRAKEVSGWMPDFEEDIDQDSKSDDELSNEGSFDENGGLRITPNVEGESDLEEVAETIFEKEQASVEVKEGCNSVQKETRSEDPFNIYDLLDKKKSAYLLDMEGDNSGHKVQDVEQESVTKNNSPLNSYKNVTERSTCSGHFKKCDIPRSGGSILQLMEELIKVGQTMGYNMEGCITNIGDIINSQGANDETKMEDIEFFNIKLCWGNFGFEFVHSPSVGNSGGEWAPNGKKLIIISVYAPQELREKKMLWDYLILVLKSWNDDVIIMGDFNEVRTQDERHGSIFNAHGADAFNLFISSARLEEVPLDGCKFTWCHKSGSKMSKLDRFLISKGLLNSCPNISSITLDRYLSDHRPILMRESHHDYRPSPFRFFHYWFELEGFDTFVKQTWNDAQVTDSNAISMFMKKMKYLKEKIRMWVKANKENSKSHKQCLQEELSKIDLLLDKGEGSSTLISKRMEILKSIQDFVKLDTMELAQKAKIKWAIEGDENSKYYHGVLNKKRNQLAIRGILVEGRWIESPILVKDEFLSYFASRFNKPPDYRLHIDLDFPNKLSLEQQMVLEIEVTREEIKKAVWDCGVDKSPGPDGFTFGFYRRYWTFLENDVVEAVLYFFNHGQFPKGSNSSFITLIPKTQEAKMMKDFRPITLIGSLYKIIAKILANRLVVVLEDLVSDVQSAFVAKRQILDGPFILNELFQWCKMKKKHTMIFKVDFEKAYDSVRWDYLDDVLKRFGFGEKWCGWIQNCLLSSKGSVIVNGSPTKEFQFHRGLKQGDPLSPFLFLLIMESLHISMQRVVDAGLFRGIQVGSSLQVSHLFYADDAVFMGHWSEANIDTILRVLDCFYHASGLRINMLKSKLMGISVSSDKVDQAAKKIGCAILQVPFSYLGSKVGCLMSRIQSWSEIVNNILTRLSKWKLKTLSIGGRLTLLKSVLGSLPIYHMSLFKVSAKVLLNMESIRCHFFNGIEHNVKSQYGLNGIKFWLLKKREVLEFRVSTLLIELFYSNGFGVSAHNNQLYGPKLLKGYMEKTERLVNMFEATIRPYGWISSRRIYALETQKNISVALKLSHDDLLCSFRRAPRAGAEELQYIQLVKIMEGITLFDSKDRWRWSLEGGGEFTVASVRNLLDANSLPMVSSKTRWIKAVPIKVNIHAWKVKLDILPTRLNISKSGMDIESILCPLCEKNVESSSHIFFTCPISREIFRKVLLWWEIDLVMVSSYNEWLDWLLSIRLHSKHKELFEGVCYVLWWYIWNFRNKSIFGLACPSKALIFEEVVTKSFIWCKHRRKKSFSWVDWLKNPYLVTL